MKRKYWCLLFVIIAMPLTAFCQDIKLAELLNYVNLPMKEVSSNVTLKGWEYKSSLKIEGEGIMWRKYDDSKIESVLSYSKYESSMPSIKENDKILVFLGTYSSTYNITFLRDLLGMGFTEDQIQPYENYVEKHYLNKTYHIVVREGKGQYAYFISTTAGYIIWSLSELASKG